MASYHATGTYAADIKQENVHNIWVKTESDNFGISHTCNKPGLARSSVTLPPIRTLGLPWGIDIGMAQETEIRCLSPDGLKLGSRSPSPSIIPRSGHCSGFNVCTAFDSADSTSSGVCPEVPLWGSTSSGASPLCPPEKLAYGGACPPYPLDPLEEPTSSGADRASSLEDFTLTGVGPPYPLEDYPFCGQSGLVKREATKNVNRRVNRNNEDRSLAYRSGLVNIATPVHDVEQPVVADQSTSLRERDLSAGGRTRPESRKNHANRGKARRDLHQSQMRLTEQVLVKLYGFWSKYEQTFMNRRKSGLRYQTFNIERAANREMIFTYRNFVKPMLVAEHLPKVHELWRRCNDVRACRGHLLKWIKPEAQSFFQAMWATDDGGEVFREGFEEFAGMY